MHEAGGGQRLAPEPGDERRVVCQMFCQQLHCDVAFESLVNCQQNGRHAADAEAALDPVAAVDDRCGAHQKSLPVVPDVPVVLVVGVPPDVDVEVPPRPVPPFEVVVEDVVLVVVSIVFVVVSIPWPPVVLVVLVEGEVYVYVWVG